MQIGGALEDVISGGGGPSNGKGGVGSQRGVRQRNGVKSKSTFEVKNFEWGRRRITKNSILIIETDDVKMPVCENQIFRFGIISLRVGQAKVGGQVHIKK